MRVTSPPVSPFPSYLFPCSITSYWHSVTSHVHVLETPACVYMFSLAPLCRHNQTLESRYSITKTGAYWCYSSSSSRAGQPRQSSCIRWLLVAGSRILSFFPSVCLPILLAKPHYKCEVTGAAMDGPLPGAQSGPETSKEADVEKGNTH